MDQRSEELSPEEVAEVVEAREATADAIKLVWSHHREIIGDIGPVPLASTLKQS